MPDAVMRALHCCSSCPKRLPSRPRETLIEICKWAFSQSTTINREGMRMQRISWKCRLHKGKLLEHYKKNMAVAIKAVETDGLPLEEFCWMVLSWQTAQLVADIGRDEAATMFEAWAALTQQGLFGDFDGTDMSRFEHFEGSVIY